MLQTGFPMAICIFSAILKKEGFEVDIFDTTFYKTEKVTSDEARVENLQVKPFKLGAEFENLPSRDQMLTDLEKKVVEFQPDLIAISILEDLYPLARDMLNTIEKFQIPVIAGGVFPTFAPEIVINNPAVTMVCIGEGENAILDLCRKMASGESYESIENLWIKVNGDIKRNKLRKLTNIDVNPIPDFSLFDKKRFLKPMKSKLYKMAPIETHRGCPYACSFCNSSSQKYLYKEHTGKNFFRTKDISTIYNELKMLTQNFGIEYIYFPADTFLAMSNDYLNEFKKMYEKFKLPFYCQTRAETINEETVKHLKDMNCHSISIGLEHGNEDFRYNLLKRRVSNDTYISAIKLLNKTEIMVSVNNIIGFPNETRELVFDTINLNRKLNVYAHNAYFFTPYHGTRLHDLCVKKGFIQKNSQTINITKDSILRMPQFTPDEIKGLVRTFTLYVKFPKSRYDEIRLAEKFDETGNRVFIKLQKEFWKKYFK